MACVACVVMQQKQLLTISLPSFLLFFDSFFSPLAMRSGYPPNPENQTHTTVLPQPRALYGIGGISTTGRTLCNSLILVSLSITSLAWLAAGFRAEAPRHRSPVRQVAIAPAINGRPSFCKSRSEGPQNFPLDSLRKCAPPFYSGLGTS